MAGKLLMIAPCGMNCGTCMAFLRVKNHCPGCRGPKGQKPGGCAKCIVYNCKKLKDKKSGFCFSCPDFPCRRVKALDKRYSTKYNTSFIANLKFIEEKGLVKFLKAETNKWKCKKCGGAICCHTGECSVCGPHTNHVVYYKDRKQAKAKNIKP